MERGKKNEKYEFSPSSHLEEIGFWEKSFLSFAERPILRRRPRHAAVAEPRAGARCARARADRFQRERKNPRRRPEGTERTETRRTRRAFKLDNGKTERLARLT